MRIDIKNILGKWQESLGLRLSVFIMAITMLLFAMTIGVCIYEANGMTTERTISFTKSQMEDALGFINDNLQDVERTVRVYASNAEYYTSTKEGCYRLCEEIVRNDTSISAATMMVRHDYYEDMPEGHHLYAPAVAREPGTDIYERSNLVATSDDDFQYEETDSNWIWTNRLDAGYWCEPYQDVYHTYDFLVTYSYPLHDKDGSIYAILCADVRLSWLSDRLNNLRPTENTRVMMMTKNSHLIVHHIPQFVMPQGDDLLGMNVGEALKKEGTDRTVLSLYEKMISGERGTMKISRPALFSMCGKTDTIPEGFVLCSPVRTSGWSVAAICPKSDINAESDRLVSRIMLCSAIGLLLMVAALFYMVRRMVRPYRQFAAVDADIRTAERIQKSMISTLFPIEDKIMGRMLYASMTPAKSIGGDLYDYLLDGSKLTFIVGDVAGKGVPAAFFMASALTLFRVFAKKAMRPADIASEINNALSRDNSTMMFVTMFIGCLDLRTGEMDFCNGGHNAPVLLHDNKAEFLHMQTNLPVGVMEDAAFTEESMRLEKGDFLVVYTDGVTEAEDRNGKLYSDEQLLQFLAAGSFSSAQELCTRLEEDVRRHAGSAEQSDDITTMCIRF